MRCNRHLLVRAFRVGEDIHVSIFGGDRSHIGAVSILSSSGEIRTVCFPSHRDDAISEVWAKALRDAGIKVAVVEAGIHYDDLSKAGISTVLETCNALLKRFLLDFQPRSLEEAGD